MASSGLGIGDLSIGYSFTGASEYLKLLNEVAIRDTKSQLADDLHIVTDALQKGWQGQAEQNYVINLQNSIVKVQQLLDQTENTLKGQFSQIEQSMVQQDQNIVPID